MQTSIASGGGIYRDVNQPVHPKLEAAVQPVAEPER